MRSIPIHSPNIARVYTKSILIDMTWFINLIGEHFAPCVVFFSFFHYGSIFGLTVFLHNAMLWCPGLTDRAPHWSSPVHTLSLVERDSFGFISICINDILLSNPHICHLFGLYRPQTNTHTGRIRSWWWWERRAQRSPFWRLNRNASFPQSTDGGPKKHTHREIEIGPIKRYNRS